MASKRNRNEVNLVVVTKNKSIQEIYEAYQAGCKDFGESRVNEAISKIEKMPSDTRWHYMGKLQTNKVNKIIGKFCLIHSVDTPHLAETLSSASLKRDVLTSVLLEVNTSGELTKSGLSSEEWRKVFGSVFGLSGIQIMGLMTMAPLTEDESVIRQTFSKLRLFRNELQDEFGCNLQTLSMGMSNDYRIAISEGATILRIGSKVFSP